MRLEHIEFDNLSVSALNVRKNGEKNGDDLIPSLKSIGVIQPLLVRPARDGEGGSPTGNPRKGEGFEVIAGQRRLSALRQIAKDDAVDPIPCLVMSEDDDAKAIEASLAENIARLPMDAIDQFEAFQALIKQGQSVEDIAEQFGVTTRLVQ
ncbi:ParB N-terminal domain-containing protein [Roseibium sp. MMSF_3544]|uniref:ParB/RepB/Spo0J family partition protein n=1 Tax=unclassified Roseibium TaxID=2629323 RepID=UPI00273D1BC5|nr:ParB N-terminal domain-containing protein [Roseibium sp. MMSF_3544]